MIRQRLRLRFTKLGDLRFASHRDLVRTLLRLFRRAGLKLSMSAGYHPKPRMSVPAALAVGVAGSDEVAELELAEEMPADQFLAVVAPHCPLGLALRSATVLPPGTAKAEVVRMKLQLPVPARRQPELARQITLFLARASHEVWRDGRPEPINIRPLVEQLTLVDGQLGMTLQVTPRGSPRPREVLSALQVDDLEHEGCFLTRTRVELK
jgi:radical SAM-linked protein